jgi:hypothetical protein
MRKLNKRIAFVAAGAAVALATSGVAYAFWTGSGTGSGSASTGAGTGTVTVNQTSVVTDLAPGLPAQALSGNFTNAGTSPVYVAGITAAVTTDKAGCDATDYTLVQPSAVNAEVAVGSGVGSWSGGSIQFNNKADANQDACKGATVTITYSSN